MELTAWIQSVCALVAVVLSVVALRQNKRIKELHDITKELADQTIELQKQTSTTEKILEHEMLLSMEKRMPFFEPGGIQFENGKPFYKITLKNIGKKAFKIQITNEESIQTMHYGDSCGTDGELKINIKYLDPLQTFSKPFALTIHFFDNLNLPYFQTIQQIGPALDYEISEPKRTFKKP